MILSIDSIEKNSGKGSPVYSKTGLYTCTQFRVFQKPLPQRSVESEESEPDLN